MADIGKQEKEDIIVQKSEESPKTFVNIVKSNRFYEQVAQIFYWRDAIKSGLVFGIVNFFYFLVTWGDYSVLTLVSYVLLTFLIPAFAYVHITSLRARYFQGVTNVDNPLKAKLGARDFHIRKEDAEQIMHTILELSNLSFDTLKEIILVYNSFTTIKYGLAFYFLSILGNWVSGTTLVYLVLLGFFIWPRLYQEKQKEIDALYATAHKQAHNYLQLVLSKIPPKVSTQIQAMTKPKQSVRGARMSRGGSVKQAGRDAFAGCSCHCAFNYFVSGSGRRHGTNSSE